MKRVLASLIIAVTASACSPLEVDRFISSTAETASILSNDHLASLRTCESTDNYEAVSRSGAYRGAYQFDQATWDDVAGRHFPWLVEIDPIAAEFFWQDAMARALYSERGSQPWPNCGQILP